MSKFRLLPNKQTMLGAFLLLVAVVMLKWALALTAFTPANQPIGYVAQDEITDFNLNSGSETVYRPEYKREYWSGNLHAYPVDAAGNVDLGGERWVGGASAQIGAQDWDGGRFIATMKDDGTKVAFRSENLSSTQQATLSGTINGAAYSSAQIVSYLRGDRSGESASGLRERASLLGDIVHSRPFYVDDDNPTLFVGANDGMLHAINTDNGRERWAYVPSMLLGKMRNLANNPYSHDYYVDGQITVGDINVAGTSKRVLFGSLGGGGKGLYALDVSTLSAASDTDVANKILWEITPSQINYGTATTSYGRLGYTYGSPVLVKVKSGASAIDALVVGNGYDDGATGQSYLYVINAATGALIQAIQAGSSGSANPNGIFNPVAIDTDGDGNADRVYGGDLNGTMWKFDLSSTTPSLWSATALLTTSPAQAITATPGVAAHPNGGYLVTFGTGKMLTGDYGVYNHTSSSWTSAATGDLGDSAIHYVYGIWDGAPAANDTLLVQTLSERSYTYAGTTTRVRRITANVPNWSSGAGHHKGWKVALPAGERVIGEGSFTENGRFYLNTYNPTVAPYLVGGTNTDIHGENWLLELNYLTGGSSSTPFLDMDGNLLLNDADRIVYTATDTLPAGEVAGNPILSPNQDGIPVGKLIATGVQSQPILVQLQTLNTTLFNQNPDVVFPATTTAVRGVAGGHFDIDYFYGPSINCSNVAGTGSVASGGGIDFAYSNNKTVSAFSIKINGKELLTASNPGSQSARNLELWVVAHYDASDYTLARNNGQIEITANAVGTAFNATTANIVVSASGISASNYTKTALTGGVNSTGSPYSAATTSCTRNSHDHEYDDLYDKTGLNMLNPSDTAYKLSRAIPSTSTSFKVLMMNQYLSPAANLHIGDAAYHPSSAAGYVSARNYQTSAGLDLATVPAYTRSNIGSLVVNLPVDAFTIKDWWGNGDVRTGVHPTSPQCAYNGLNNSSGNATGSAGADLYTPVIPPANGVNGAGVAGTTSGARHNGTLTVQIIKASTPNSALEENVAGRPEYGYRIRQADFYSYVLAEYIIYWHHPRRVCYQDATTQWYNGSGFGNGLPTASSGAWNTAALMTGTGWSKAPPEDTKTTSAASTPASGSTDPKLGALGSTGTLASTTTAVAGNVTTTTNTYIDGSQTVIVQTRNSNGSVTIRTQEKDAAGAIVSDTTVIVADASGSVKTGGDERGLQARTGRISWRELVRP